MIIDLHQDISIPLIDYGVDHFVEINAITPQLRTSYAKYGVLDQINYDRLSRGKYQVISASSCPLKIGKRGIYVPYNPYLELSKHLELFEKLMVNHDDKFFQITNRLGLKASKFPKIGLILSVEGIYFVKHPSDIKLLGILTKHNVKIAAPLWSIDSELGGGSGSIKGLSNLGKEVIKALNDLNIIIDTSHTNKNSLKDMVTTSKKPVIMTHTLSKTIYDHPRNIDDEDVKSICDNAGIIGVCFIKNYSGSNNLTKVVQHITHIIKVGSVDCVSIGSDFGGMVKNNLIKDLEYPDKITNLCDLLKSNGCKENLIDKLLYKNAYRFLRENLN